MKHIHTKTFKVAVITSALIGALALAACSPEQAATSAEQATASSSASANTTTGFYASKTPYQPKQDASAYETVPAGFNAVMIQHVARHGSRGLSSPDDDDLSLQLWQQAKQENALTAKGEQFGELLVRFQEASKKLGYGNLSRLGELEHQQMAERLIGRHQAMLQNAFSEQRRITVEHSGRDRADDSGANFVQRFTALLPAAATLLDTPQVSHQTLYFHKAEGADNAAYLAYRENDPRLMQKLQQLHELPKTNEIALSILHNLYSEDFVKRLAAGKYHFKATDDDAELSNAVEAAQAVYSLYGIAADLPYEGDWNFGDYITPEQAKWMAYLDDAETFYERGPGFAGDDVTYRMAHNLLNDFFARMDAVVKGDKSYVAGLRFTHAQALIPFAAVLGIKDAATGVPEQQTYSYQNSNWRSEWVSPMSANVQWELYSNTDNQYLVRMLHNEQQTAFKAECKPYQQGSFFYEFAELKRCYGY